MSSQPTTHTFKSEDALASVKQDQRREGSETMTFKEAQKQCRKVGTARARGDALRAMYAELIAFKWYAIGNAEKFYAHLQGTCKRSLEFDDEQPTIPQTGGRDGDG
jgi:hypothetical protein